MAFQLEDINFKTVADPKGFIEEGDQAYKDRVAKAADKIISNRDKSPIVLLSGPSGSSKTTTSMKIAEELNRRGIGTHYIGMDDYFKTIDDNSPRTPEGDLDLESPLCLDMELMNRHFDMLSKGERIYVPKYEFARRMRSLYSYADHQRTNETELIQPSKVVIVEGIHALNDMITNAHPEAFKLYISARSDVLFGDRVVFKRTWFRLVRRMVRDYNFRGSSAAETMSMWANVRRGEKLYISPYKNKADYQFDTALPYELPVFNETATQLFQSVPEGIERFDELRQVLPALQLFGVIDHSLIPKEAMIREFIGGGIYEY